MNNETFVAMLTDAKKASKEYLASIGIDEDLENAVSTFAHNGFTIENEADCPLYVASITAGWWIIRGRMNSGPEVVRVAAAMDEMHVMRTGDECTVPVVDAVRGGVRFVRRIDLTELLA